MISSERDSRLKGLRFARIIAAAMRVAMIFCALTIACGGAAASAEVRGRVRRADTLEPIAGATVHVQGLSQPSVLTAADGTFTLAVPADGEVVVTAALPYDPAASFNVVTGGSGAEDGDRGVDIRLEVVPLDDNAEYVPIKAEPPNACGDCHSEQLAQWRGSAHAGAARDAWVLDLFSGSGTPGGAAGYVFTASHDAGETGFCATCHAPIAEARAPGTVALDAVSGAAELEGVSCSACHQIDQVNEDVAALHLAGNATMRFPLAGVGGSATHEYVWGPLDDVTFRFMRASFQPLFAESRFCASCHQYDNPDSGAPGQHTYSEWLASPYAVAGDGYRTCQHCHMPAAIADGPIADPPAEPPLVRPAAQRHAHDFVGSSAEGLQAAIALDLQARIEGDEVVVEARITNAGAGHHFPTGVSIRNALLVVGAAAGGAPLTQTGGPTVPWWADDEVPGVQEGDYAGQPGAGFAKILAGRINGAGEEVMPVLFIDAERVESDTAIAAGETRTVSLRFARDGAAEATVSARLLYRRAFRALAVTKGWTTTPSGGPIEIEVARAERTVTAGGGFCAGDCNGDGAVTVDELVTAVGIALGGTPLARCPAVNVEEDTMVTINELIGAVNNALAGCP